MTKNKTFLYSIAFLSLSIPVQGRFVYGITVVIELLLLEIIGALADVLVKKLKFEAIKSYFIMMILISFTILFRQIMVIAYSEIALTMGLVFYFPTVSTYLIDSVFKHQITKLFILIICFLY